MRQDELATVDLANYRLGDNLAAALGEALKMRRALADGAAAIMPGRCVCVCVSVFGLGGGQCPCALRARWLAQWNDRALAHRHHPVEGLLLQNNLLKEPPNTRMDERGERNGTEAVCYVIHSNKAHLTTIDLSLNMIGSNGGILLSSAITGNVVLQSLKLHGCGLRDKGIAVLSETLKECSAVSYLDFSKNGLGPGAAVHLNGLIEFSVRLKEFYLGWNDLRRGGELILRNLKRNDSGLHTLSLPWNGMRDDDGGAVEFALHHAAQLRVLDISNNEIRERAAMVIAGALKRTMTLDRLVMRNNPIGVRGGNAMFKLMRCVTRDSNSRYQPGCFV